MLELTVLEDAAGQRLDKFVRKALAGVPLSHVYKLIRTRKVRVNGARGRAEQLLAAGDKVAIRGTEERLLGATPPAKAPVVKEISFAVLHEDEHLLVVDKPSGLAAHPGTGITGATLVEEARAYLKASSGPPGTFLPSPAHRLDRDTSGVILVAKTRKAMVRLTELFTDGSEIRKTYLAIAKGKMPRERGTIDTPLSEHEQTSRSKAARGVNMQPARTLYRVVGAVREASLLELTLETGRTHQIRRHLEAVGHPVLGDRRYGDFPFNRQAKQRWGLARLALHAWKLTLPHPITARKLSLRAPIPDELGSALRGMGLPRVEETQ
jgi:23S rRNA pseudouridine955/2504/2580 synthase